MRQMKGSDWSEGGTKVQQMKGSGWSPGEPRLCSKKKALIGQYRRI